MTLQRIGWRENGDGLDVALVVDRVLAQGARARWLPDGDYLVETQAGVTGVRTQTPAPAALPDDARALHCSGACERGVSREPPPKAQGDEQRIRAA